MSQETLTPTIEPKNAAIAGAAAITSTDGAPAAAGAAALTTTTAPSTAALTGAGAATITTPEATGAGAAAIAATLPAAQETTQKTITPAAATPAPVTITLTPEQVASVKGTGQDATVSCTAMAGDNIAISGATTNLGTVKGPGEVNADLQQCLTCTGDKQIAR